MIGTLPTVLHHVYRSLMRRPWTTVFLVMLLSTSIGAVAGTLGLLDVVAFRALPVRSPQELVLFGTGQERGVSRSAMPSTDLFSYPHFTALREQAGAFQSVAAVGSVDAQMTIEATSLAGVPAAGRASVRLVSDNYFELLNVIPATGTTFSSSLDRSGGDQQVVVVSFPFWRDRLAKNPAAVGSTVRTTAGVYTIVGVAADGFYGEAIGRQPDMWAPLSAQPSLLNEPSMLAQPNTYWMILLARLKPGVSAANAAASTSELFRRISLNATPDGTGLSAADRERIAVILTAAPRGITAHAGLAANALSAVALLEALLVLILCSSAVGIMAAAQESRQQELAIHAALGASQWRIRRLLITEWFVLVFISGALATAIAPASQATVFVPFVRTMLNLRLDRMADPRSFGFVAAISIITFALIAGGLIAAGAMARRFNTTGPQLLTGLVPQARVSQRTSIFRPLVLAQVGVSVVLLYLAGLMALSAHNLAEVPTGVDMDKTLLVRLNWAATGLPRPRLVAQQPSLLAAVAAIPGVHAAGLSSSSLLTGGFRTQTVQVDGYRPDDRDGKVEPIIETVTADYFRALGVRMVAGRSFETRAVPDLVDGIIVNEAFVARYFSRRMAIGSVVHLSPTTCRGCENALPVIGVVENVKQTALKATFREIVYLPATVHLTTPLSTLQVGVSGRMADVRPAIERLLSQSEMRVPVVWSRTPREQVGRLMTTEIGLAELGGVVSTTATLFTVIGIYGVVGYQIRLRRKEMAVRMALGARPSHIRRMVVVGDLLWWLGGAGLGVAGAIAAGKGVQGLLFGTASLVPWLLGGAVLTVLATSVLTAMLGSQLLLTTDLSRSIRE
jgi:predicted permease